MSMSMSMSICNNNNKSNDRTELEHQFGTTFTLYIINQSLYSSICLRDYEDDDDKAVEKKHRRDNVDDVDVLKDAGVGVMRYRCTDTGTGIHISDLPDKILPRTIHAICFPMDVSSCACTGACIYSRFFAMKHKNARHVTDSEQWLEKK